MRFFITEKKLASIINKQLEASKEEQKKSQKARDKRDERDERDEKVKAEQTRHLKEMQDFKDVGQSFEYLGYDMWVIEYNVVYRDVYYSYSPAAHAGVTAICEYRHENGDLMIKEFSYEQLPVMKGGK